MSQGPFQGETMCCVMCGKVERSDPDIELQWRAIMLDGETFYVCPDEFPPDGSGVETFTEAYVAVLHRCLELRNVSGKH